MRNVPWDLGEKMSKRMRIQEEKPERDINIGQNQQYGCFK